MTSPPERFCLILSGLVETSAGFENTWVILAYVPGETYLDWQQISLDSSGQGYNLNLDSCHPVNPVQLVWIDSARNIIPNTSLGQLNRFLAQAETRNPINVVNQQFVPVDINPSGNTLQLQVPARLNLGWNDVKAGGYIRLIPDPKTQGVPIVNLVDLPISERKVVVTPITSLEPLVVNPNLTDIIVGSTCIGNCGGKRCNEDDGCGNQCGCPPGYSCVSGECQKNSPCAKVTACGGGGGTCPGSCPNGQTCVRGINGYYNCVPVGWQYFDIILLVIVVFFVLVVVIIVISYGAREYGPVDRKVNLLQDGTV